MDAELTADFTSSTSFANPAVTVGRALSDSFAGISPGFIVAQLIGGAIGAGLVPLLYPTAAPNAAPSTADRAPVAAVTDSVSRGTG